MTLLILSLAYMIGVGLGQFLWNMGIIGCDTLGWLWIGALLPVPALLWWERRLDAPSLVPMTWPRSAGFAPVRPALSGAILTAIALCVLGGLLRYASQPSRPCWEPGDLAFYNAPATDDFYADGDPVILTATVSNYPTISEGRQPLHLRVTALEQNGESRTVSGQARLTTSSRERYVYGQPVQVTGVLVEPPRFDTFDYRAYLARKGIHSLIQRPRIEIGQGPNQGNPVLRLLYTLRAKGETIVNRSLPEPYAALANGMMLGIESGIPDDLYDEFNLTGTSHVIVISGSNVAIVAGVLMALSVRLLGKRRGLWPTLIGIGLYAFLVGGDAAVVRAALMGSLFVVATVMARRSTAIISLAAACFAMTLLNPLTLWDVGFQLSSAATAGLILFSPGLTAALDKIWPGLGQGGHLTGDGTLLTQTGQASTSLLRGLLQDGLLITLAANFTTLPLVVYYFERLSLVSPLTNLLIAPAQPFIMLWGGAGLIIGLFGLSWLAQAVLWVPWLSLAWTVAMVQWTAALPGASLDLPNYGIGWLLATYLLMAALRWRGWLGHQLSRGMAFWGKGGSPGASEEASAGGSGLGGEGRLDRTLALLSGGPALMALGVALFLLVRMAGSGPDGRLHVHFLDIGQGDAIFIQTPSGRQILVDGGADPQVLFAELGAVMPFWDRDIDMLILTHPDLDHMGAQLGLLERMGIEQAVTSPVTLSDEDGDAWRAIMDEAGVPITAQHAGGWLDLGDGVALWTLWPLPPEQMLRAGIATDDKNEQALVQKLVYGQFELLLTGDAGLPVERWLTRNGTALHAALHADVLKIGHHGSDSSTGPSFVNAVSPSLSVIQVGGDNPYGHPHREVLDAVSGRAVLRNDENGRIHLWTNGDLMWVEVETEKKGESIFKAQ